MRFQVTSVGAAYLQAHPNEVPKVEAFVLGSSSGYTPSVDDTGIHGSTVYAGTSSKPVIITASLARYNFFIDGSVPTLSFGEMAIYLKNGILLAVGSNSTLIAKTGPSLSGPGGSISIDAYLDFADYSNINLFASLRNSASDLIVPTVSSPDALPFPSSAVPNVYSVGSVNANVGNHLAVSDNLYWHLNGYDVIAQDVVSSSLTTSAVSFSTTTYDLDDCRFPGEMLAMFTSGVNRGLVRTLSSSSINGGNRVYSFQTPMLSVSSSASFRILRVSTKLRWSPSRNVLLAYDYLTDSWTRANGPTGANGDAVFYLNDNTVNHNYTIPVGMNAMSAGPITIADGVQITVPDGSAWNILG